MHGVEEVALFAIMLREAARNRHTSPESVGDDMETCRGEISLATLSASENFTSLDWHLAEMLYDNDERAVEVAALLYELEDSVAAEALLHAAGPNGKRTRAHWADEINARWRQVRESIAAFEHEGVATTFGDLDNLADHAYCLATGASHDEVLDDFYEPMWDAAVEDEARDGDLKDPSLVGKLARDD
jgi:hypothetical protein